MEQFKEGLAKNLETAGEKIVACDCHFKKTPIFEIYLTNAR
jgi:hypothetical protein